MSMIRCAECHANIPVPAELEARTMKCQYCGATQPVPDLLAREHALLQRKILEQEERERTTRALIDQQDRREAAVERKKSIRWGRITAIFTMLLAPTIIAITVYDLPARLGFGDAGADRVSIVAEQLKGRGCTVLSGSKSEYATGAVTKLLPGAKGCVRVLAAGGPNQHSLTIRIFNGDGKEVGKSASSADPQLEYCTTTEGTLRYEVVPGMLDKGRLTHMALACPAAAAAPAEAPPATTNPKKHK
ncbi:MAG TPA: hypothetical protein PLF40_17890 [Kofleriaceae bacterium]|nr:hypothetical protein [Kofleriaceae bacterium]